MDSAGGTRARFASLVVVVDLDVAEEALAAAPGRVLSGRWGALAHGLPVVERLGEPQLVVPGDAPVVVRNGVAVLALEALLRVLLPQCSLAQAVALLDAARHQHLLPDPTTLLGGRVPPRLRTAVALSDPRAASALESLVRLALVLAGLGSVEPQARAVEGGHRFDLLLAWARLWVECDGLAFHPLGTAAPLVPLGGEATELAAQRRTWVEERRQQGAVAALRGGHRVLRLVWEDVSPSPLPAVRAVRAAALASPGNRCRQLRKRGPEPAVRSVLLLAKAWSVPGTEAFARADLALRRHAAGR